MLIDVVTIALAVLMALFIYANFAAVWSFTWRVLEFLFAVMIFGTLGLLAALGQ